MGFLSNDDFNSFVIRMWREGDPAHWRGHITHIQSRQSSYFLTLGQLESFMRRFPPIAGQEQATPPYTYPDPSQMPG